MSKPHVDTKAFVTGGTQGLGLAIATRFAQEGCSRIVIAGRDASKGRKAADTLSAEGAAKAEFLRLDLEEWDAVPRAIDEAARRMGGINCLVNAAADTNRGSLYDTDPRDLDRLMTVNFKSPFLAMQRFAQIVRGSGDAGSIVNILSMVIHCGQSYLAGYSASKAALANLTKNSAQALRQDRIRVNGIACGWMNTPAEDAIQRKFHGADDDWVAKAARSQPFGRLVDPQNVAVLASFLAGPFSGVMTGAIIDFDQNVSGAYPE
jgi:NAD(P)-dependent dehydrogenase (short-subunit alcohol dehydrogenase family)